MRCIYNEPYLGQCKQEALPGSNPPRCKRHTIVCSNKDCDNPAIAGCGHASSLVCGGPYCAKCGKHKAPACPYERRP